MKWIAILLTSLWSMPANNCPDITFPIKVHDNKQLNLNDSLWISDLNTYEVVNYCYVFKFSEGNLVITYDLIDSFETFIVKNDEYYYKCD